MPPAIHFFAAGQLQERAGKLDSFNQEKSEIVASRETSETCACWRCGLSISPGHGRHQEADENRDDRNQHQKLDQRKAGAIGRPVFMMPQRYLVGN